MSSSSSGLSRSIVKPPPPMAKIVRTDSGRRRDEVARVAEEDGLERRLARRAVDGLDTVGPGARPGTHDARELAADEVQRRAVLRRVPRRHPVEDRLEVGVTAGALPLRGGAGRPPP